jgi:hypothetical protein
LATGDGRAAEEKKKKKGRERCGGGGEVRVWRCGPRRLVMVVERRRVAVRRVEWRQRRGEEGRSNQANETRERVRGKEHGCTTARLHDCTTPTSLPRSLQSSVFTRETVARRPQQIKPGRATAASTQAHQVTVDRL